MCFNTLFALTYRNALMIAFVMKATSSSCLSHPILFCLVSLQSLRFFSCVFVYFMLYLSIGLSCFTINCAACLSACTPNLCDVFRSTKGRLPSLLQAFVSHFCITEHMYIFLPAANSLSQVISIRGITMPSVVSMLTTQNYF